MGRTLVKLIFYQLTRPPRKRNIKLYHRRCPGYALYRQICTSTHIIHTQALYIRSRFPLPSSSPLPSSHRPNAPVSKMVNGVDEPRLPSPCPLYNPATPCSSLRPNALSTEPVLFYEQPLDLTCRSTASLFLSSLLSSVSLFFFCFSFFALASFASASLFLT